MLESNILSNDILTNIIPEPDIEVPKPQIGVVESNSVYGKFTVGPLERGYATTIGNSVRRVLLSSIPGTAITWVKVEDVLHEYAFLHGVKEEVMDFLLNVKQVRIRSLADRPGKMRLEVTGEGRVCAGDIGTSADFEIVNPELHLATLNSDEARIVVEFNVEQGTGYVPIGVEDGTQAQPIGVLPIDAIFNPIRKVNCVTERTRIGNVTDYERLVLEMWTDGSVTPIEALQKASEILVDHFFLFNNVGRPLPDEGERIVVSIPPDLYQTAVEKLELSPRTLNCLKRAHLLKVGQVIETSDDDLLKIRNFGEKSLHELKDKLQVYNVQEASDGESGDELIGNPVVNIEGDVSELLAVGDEPPIQVPDRDDLTKRLEGEEEDLYVDDEDEDEEEEEDDEEE
jgi:DNA-directed RNA polymerase subunit alpha